MAPASKSYLRSLFSKVHPQLPLDQRQSNQLLSILKTSFQKQLDLAHPPVGETQRIPLPTCELKSTALDDRKRKESDPCITPQISTVRHLESILSNPLLATRPDPSLFIFGGRALNSIKKPGNTVLISLSSPLEARQWFKEHVACGEADLDIAKAYLRAIQRLRASISATSSVAAGKLSIEVAAGEDVMQWLLSSDINTKEFLSDFEFSSILVNSFVEEHNHIGIKSLLSPLPFLEGSDMRLVARWQSIAMKNWIESSLRKEVETETLVNGFLNCVDTYQNYLLSARLYNAKHMKYIFGKGGTRLAENLAVNSGIVSVPVYNKFLKAVGKWSDKSSVARSILELYHPVEPDATALLVLLESKYTMENLGKMSPGKRRVMMQMCLDAGHTLLSQRKHVRASWILEYASRNFAAELEPKHEKRSSTTECQMHGDGSRIVPTLRKSNDEKIQNIEVFAVG